MRPWPRGFMGFTISRLLKSLKSPQILRRSNHLARLRWELKRGKDLTSLLASSLWWLALVDMMEMILPHDLNKPILSLSRLSRVAEGHPQTGTAGSSAKRNQLTNPQQLPMQKLFEPEPCKLLEASDKVKTC